jgi:hypothetical protein
MWNSHILTKVVSVLVVFEAIVLKNLKCDIFLKLICSITVVKITFKTYLNLMCNYVFAKG